MMLSRETMLQLMALADDELDGEPKEQMERLVAENDEARRVVDAMRGTGVRAWLIEAMDERARAANGIAEAVMGRLHGAPPRRRSRASVVTVGIVVASSLAMAAAVAISIRSAPHRDVAARGTNVLAPSVETSANGEIPSSAAELASHGGPGAQRGVEVEEIDSPKHVSIFEISAMATASARSSVVVWIDDDPGEK